jgi:predicted component of type VI protein secretion system
VGWTQRKAREEFFRLQKRRINIKGILAQFMKNLEILMALITQQRNFSGHKFQELVNQWKQIENNIRVLNKTVWNTN